MYLGSVSWGNNHMEETGVTVVRPKNKETGDNEHNTGFHTRNCVVRLYYATTLEGGRRLTSMED